MAQYLFEHALTALIGFVLAIFFLARIFREQERPSASMAWVMAIVLIPYVGVPAYILFGGRKLRRMARRKSSLYKREPARRDEPEGEFDDVQRLLEVSGFPPARSGNSVLLLGDGEIVFTEVMSMIGRAKESIDVMIYILGNDEVGREIVHRLADRAREGIQVRLLVDSLGCLRTSGRFLNPLREAGGQVGVFMPVLPLRRRKGSANLRNHRKMIIIDGQEAMTGGMNFSLDYMGRGPDPDRWIDSLTLLQGPVVGDLHDLFEQDWRFALDKEPLAAVGAAALNLEPTGNVRAQIVASGPDVPEDSLHDAILSTMHDARSRVWVVTPYFVPDEGLYKALLLQARLGRDVRIIIPLHSNHYLANLARGRFLRRLRAVGAQVYAHPTRMMHAKHIIVDDHVAISGTINIDSRSFLINYEVAMFIYSPAEVAATARWVESLMGDCVHNPPLRSGRLRRWGEDVCWLLSPLM